MTCHVYIIAHMKDRKPVKPVKIGISSDPEKRIATLQTANPNPLVLLCAFATPDRTMAKMLESAFHQVMAEHRLAGEWFDIQPMWSVAFMCQNFRGAFQRFLGDDPEVYEQAVIQSGLLDNETKLDAWATFLRQSRNDNNEKQPCQ